MYLHPVRPNFSLSDLEFADFCLVSFCVVSRQTWPRLCAATVSYHCRGAENMLILRHSRSEYVSWVTCKPSHPHPLPVNGSYACENNSTLNGLLKTELAFQGCKSVRKLYTARAYFIQLQTLCLVRTNALEILSELMSLRLVRHAFDCACCKQWFGCESISRCECPLLIINTTFDVTLYR